MSVESRLWVGAGFDYGPRWRTLPVNDYRSYGIRSDGILLGTIFDNYL